MRAAAVQPLLAAAAARFSRHLPAKFKV